MGFLGTLADILTREPKKRPEFGPMSDALAAQNAGYGVTGGLLNAVDPYILTPMSSPEHQYVRDTEAALRAGKKPAGMSREAMERVGMAGIFAGPGAKTADLVALKKAEELAAKGVDNEAVRQATGWFKGMDGKWRFEISDDAAEFKTKISKSKGFNVPLDDWRGPSGTRGELGQALSHAELFAAYPDLANVYIDAPFGAAAQKSPSGQYYQKQPFFPEKVEVNSKIMSDKQKSMEALLHEVEHAVQAREGFAPGGNIRGMSMKDYQRLAGEIEARDVSARMSLTPEQRLATPPDLRPDAIVRYGNGPQMSVPGGLISDGSIRDVKIGDTKISYRVTPDGVVDIQSVRTPASKRGAGSARTAMTEFLDEVDKNGYGAELISSPLDRKTDGQKLFDFYSSLGFKDSGGRFGGMPTMSREPAAATAYGIDQVLPYD